MGGWTPEETMQWIQSTQLRHCDGFVDALRGEDGKVLGEMLETSYGNIFVDYPHTHKKTLIVKANVDASLRGGTVCFVSRLFFSQTFVDCLDLVRETVSGLLPPTLPTPSYGTQRPAFQPHSPTPNRPPEYRRDFSSDLSTINPSSDGPSSPEMNQYQVGSFDHFDFSGDQSRLEPAGGRPPPMIRSVTQIKKEALMISCPPVASTADIRRHPSGSISPHTQTVSQTRSRPPTPAASGAGATATSSAPPRPRTQASVFL